MTIRILPPNTVNRIAAGEVIERPASAVKELVENSIDAKSTRIEISLINAGKTLIKVEDNGSGMTKQELGLCVERHATSKLPDDDLLQVKYMGFRGEALPSIASVSRFAMTSRKHDSEQAWQINIEGGDFCNLVPAACKQGTSVEIRDLFYATPARLKLLRSDRTEIEKIKDIVMRLAMANPHIDFMLSCDGKILAKYQGNRQESGDSRLNRLGDILGKDFRANSLAIDYKRDEIKLSGFASLPTYNRGTSSEQYLFVNNRPVRDKLLLGTVKAAYQDFLERNRHPIVALFLDLPPEQVDVNVHPAKAEVRFRDTAIIRGMIISALKNSLASGGQRASSSISQVAGNLFRPQQFPSTQFSSPQFPSHNYNNVGEHNLPQNSFFDYAPPLARPLEQTNITNSPQPNYRLGAACGQLHNTYIVAQTGDGIILVDQHAAHERLVYEKMKTAIEKSGIARQKLLIPEIVELGEPYASHLLKRSCEFAELGLILDSFGEGTIAVREIPALLGKTDIAGLIRDLADDIEEFGESLALKEKLEHICGTIACHGSVRAGR
ncbi:MAG: DNA mismatch repair endonuclease MutL, partial [Pseudomonadota bacterium]